MWGESWTFSCDEENVQRHELSENLVKLDFAAMPEKLRICSPNCNQNKINGLFAVHSQQNWQKEPRVSRS